MTKRRTWNEMEGGRGW